LGSRPIFGGTVEIDRLFDLKGSQRRVPDNVCRSIKIRLDDLEAIFAGLPHPVSAGIACGR
jgi:hypothetical protein